MGTLKNQKEIKDEIQSAIKTIKNYQEAFNEGEIEQDMLDYQKSDNQATIEILHWVLSLPERLRKEEIPKKIVEIDEEREANRELMKANKISRKDFRTLSTPTGAKNAALQWVLGENDRYD